jgi:hypothetical protein
MAATLAADSAADGSAVVASAELLQGTRQQYNAVFKQVTLHV